MKAALTELGFGHRYTPKHVFFKHSSGTPFFALPRYAPGQRLSSIHALMIRTQLEDAGLIEEAEPRCRPLVGTVLQKTGGVAKVKAKKKAGTPPAAAGKPAPPKAGKNDAGGPEGGRKPSATKAKAHA
ncbi:hypothetical protein [Aquisphaera giovannonii]|uniref:hypothetical protein n=1 Tax=Aquisphaera giovannonii TaxID=406548 RepID=UPI0011E03068|nr:hypothetical protein [Aquisphaera giovannonii]